MRLPHSPAVSGSRMLIILARSFRSRRISSPCDRPENRGPQLGARQRRRSRLCGPLVMWSAVRLGGLGDGDGVAEGFELADVVAGLAALVGSGLVVAGSE